jgi:hypothetical protein
MPRYQLVISNRFRRDLRRLPALAHRRVLEALAALEQNPYEGTQLTNVALGAWRVRVGVTLQIKWRGFLHIIWRGDFLSHPLPSYPT